MEGDLYSNGNNNENQNLIILFRKPND